MDEDQDQDPNARIQMRFSVHHFEKAMKGLSNKQRDFLAKHGFDSSENVLPVLAIFQHGQKCINFSKSMVEQFLGIYSGDTPVKMSSDDPAIIAKVNFLKQKYMKNGPKLYTKLAVDSMAGDEDEESFMRSFYLVWLETIVCPSTSDSVEWKYLFSLVDLKTMKSSDWCSLCLQCIVIEAGNFVKRISKCPNGIPNKPIYVGGCLPMLSVSYMDYLDLNRAAIQNQINYSVPRIFNVRTSDFQLVLSVDRTPGLNRFGALNFRPNSSTPYSKSAVRLAMEQEFRRQQLLIIRLTDGSSGPSSSHQPDNSDKAHIAPNLGGNSSHDIKKVLDTILQSNKVDLLRDIQTLVENRFQLSQNLFVQLSQMKNSQALKEMEKLVVEVLVTILFLPMIQRAPKVPVVSFLLMHQTLLVPNHKGRPLLQIKPRVANAVQAESLEVFVWARNTNNILLMIIHQNSLLRRLPKGALQQL